jgi:hypothetical protein
MNRGFLFVDNTGDLFITFHMLVVRRVAVVAQSFFSEEGAEKKGNSWLRK